MWKLDDMAWSHLTHRVKANQKCVIAKLESGQAYNCSSIVIFTNMECCYTRNVKEYRSKDAMQDGYIMDKGKQERG
jgi:HJR/Mrr/RecB family endonuclease